MGDKELSQAEAGIIQGYLEAKRRLALQTECMRKWTETFKTLGYSLHRYQSEGDDPQKLDYPAPDQLREAVEQWRTATRNLQEAKQKMQDAGINLS